MKSILIISYSDLHKDPRVLKQIQALKYDYKIITIGYTTINNNNLYFYPARHITSKNLSQKEKLSLIISYFFCYQTYIKKALTRITDLEFILSYNIIKPDIIIANDWNGLFLASSLKSKHSWDSKIYFDAHEYSPKQFSNSLKWNLTIKPLINNALKKAKNDIGIMSTVCDGIAREYEKFFNYSKDHIRIITNAAEFNVNLKPKEIKDGKIRLIHHGGAVKYRKLELMIRMMKFLDPDKYELTFMLIKSDPAYYNHLLKISKNLKNINFIEPVPFSDIARTLNNYDMGVYILKPNSFNTKYSLPNKLFEFIQARLAIAIGPSVEMSKIVKDNNLGVVSKNFTAKSLARCIGQMTPEKIMEYKYNSDKNAQVLSADQNIIRIKKIIKDLE